MYMMFNYVREW